MVPSHWKIIGIWESVALMEVKLSQIFHYYFIWVIIYIKFEGRKMLITKTRSFYPIWYLQYMQRLF